MGSQVTALGFSTAYARNPEADEGSSTRPFHINAVSGTARARLQVRHTVDVDAEALLPALREHLRARGLHQVQVLPVQDRDAFLASRTSATDPWVTRVAASMERTAGRRPNIVPNIGASGPSELFRQALGTPILWLPFSYGGCNQHGPDEHGLQSLFRDGLGVMAGLWWDIGADKKLEPEQIPVTRDL